MVCFIYRERAGGRERKRESERTRDLPRVRQTGGKNPPTTVCGANTPCMTNLNLNNTAGVELRRVQSTRPATPEFLKSGGRERERGGGGGGRGGGGGGGEGGRERGGEGGGGGGNP